MARGARFGGQLRQAVFWLFKELLSPRDAVNECAASQTFAAFLWLSSVKRNAAAVTKMPTVANQPQAKPGANEGKTGQN